MYSVCTGYVSTMLLYNAIWTENLFLGSTVCIFLETFTVIGTATITVGTFSFVTDTSKRVLIFSLLSSF